MQPLLLVLLAATSIIDVMPACQPKTLLSPSQAQLGRYYDLKREGALVLTPRIMGSASRIDDRFFDPNDDRSRQGILAGILRMPYCDNPITATVRVTSSPKFLLSPEGKYIWSEYRAEVEQVHRNISGMHLEPGYTISIVRDGGAICSDAGTLRFYTFEQGFLQAPQRYLLYLTPRVGYYVTSGSDLLLGSPRAVRAVQPIDGPDARLPETTTEEVLAMLGGFTCE